VVSAPRPSRLRALTAERLHERGRALYALQDAGASIDRLIRLDRRVRHAQTTDWPGRPGGPEPRKPWETVCLCARCGELPPGQACGCWDDLDARLGAARYVG
jgi:hypothetical protein